MHSVSGFDMACEQASGRPGPWVHLFYCSMWALLWMAPVLHDDTMGGTNAMLHVLGCLLSSAALDLALYLDS